MYKARQERIFGRLPRSSLGRPFYGNIILQCMHCGLHLPTSGIEKDHESFGGIRCIDREKCATARGGKS